MQARMRSLLAEVEALTSDAEVRMAVIALTRIILQHASISLAELIVSGRIKKGISCADIPLDRLGSPADGTLVSILTELLILAENEGWNGISKDFWATLETTRPCCRLTRTKKSNLEGVLCGFVETRNDGVEGHGIPGGYDREAEIDLIKFMLIAFKQFLPKIAPNGQDLILSDADGSIYCLKYLRCFEGHLVCYRKISKGPDIKWSIKAQIQRSLFDKEEVVYQCEYFIPPNEASASQVYDIVSTYDSSWSPFCIVPQRTTDDFIGRDKELDALQEWAEDIESRACMLYGDGGIGKTTITIEFLHQMLEGRRSLQWKPQLITFYTAKQTRWGLNGLEHIQARSVGVSDVALAIARAFEEKPLEREWFKCDVTSIINKISFYLRELGVDRNSHLLILDNTETMAKNDDDIKALASQVQELSKKVGRVVLTSRRREPVEARPIEIKPFSAEDSIKFLKKRAKALQRKPVLQAGDATLRKYADSLGNKPLVLEVFIQAVEGDNTSLGKAFDRVLRMQRQDLGEFLYTDAWIRMSSNLKYLLLLMTRISDIHDEVLLKLCCLQVGVSVVEAMEALEESRGIANISRFNNKLQIVFQSEFMSYCAERTIEVNKIEQPSSPSVEYVKKRYNDFLRSASAQVHDRVSKAYRHALARAAWVAFQEERFDDCEIFYEEATLADSDNGWLYDRYAYFFFTQGRLSEALEKSKKATKLISEDPEAWFTRGIIEARLGLTDESIQSLNRATRFGKPSHLCLLQQAYAHLNNQPPDFSKARACLDDSEKTTPRDSYFNKQQAEIRSIRNKIKYQSAP